MKRRRMIHPNPETGIVDRQEVLEAFAQIEAVLDFMGGHVQIVTQRERTEVDGEAVTTRMVFEWMDRTDTRDVRPEDERPIPGVPDPFDEANLPEEDTASIPEPTVA